MTAFYEVKVTNEENLPDKDGYIICANHVSNFDFIFLTLNFRYERFAKILLYGEKELFNGSLASRLIVRIGGMVCLLTGRKSRRNNGGSA